MMNKHVLLLDDVEAYAPVDDDRDAAMPLVAESADVEVMYTTADVQTKDITQEVLVAVADVPSIEGIPPAPALSDLQNIAPGYGSFVSTGKTQLPQV